MSKYIPHVDRDKYACSHLKPVNKKYLVINYLEKEKDNAKIPDEFKNILINKRAYINQLESTIMYINYFIEYFDEDRELLASYMSIMFAITNRDVEFGLDNFVDILLAYLGSESMVEKIVAMVEHNVDPTMVDPPKSMKENKKSPDESLQLTIDHLKAILAISIIHKISIPMISCYYQCRKETLDISERDYHFRCFASMIQIFDEAYDVNMYNKLSHTATTRISKTQKQGAMWDRRKRMGVTQDSYINTLMKNLFIEISQKTIFDKSAIKFIHVCFDNSIKHELIQQDPNEYIDMDMNHSQSDDEVTKFERLQINNAKSNSKKLSRSSAAIDDIIRRLSKEYNVDLDEDVLNFYIQNINPIETQLNLVFIYFSPYLSYETLQYAKPREFIKLMVIMRSMLFKLNYIHLPYLITGRFDNTKAKRFNKKRLEKYITNHPNYEDLMDEYGYSRGLLNKDKLYEQVRDCFVPMYIVDHEMPERLEDYIDPSNNEAIVVDELIRLMSSI